MERRFPIMERNYRQDSSIPWNIIAQHETQARTNHGQTLERLAQRGGLSWCEAAAVLEDRPWQRMDESEAKACVLKHCHFS